VNCSRRILLAVGILLVVSAPLLAKPAAGLTDDRTAATDALVRETMKKRGIPGLSIALAANDKLIYSKGFGLADVENDVPAAADTVYRTASIAKTFTAVAVMQLVEQKKIDLDRPVDEYYPAFPKKKWPVTARQLLSHMAGVRHYAWPFESLNTKHYFDVPSSLRTFDADPLLFKPGTDFHYSTFGYNLLGALVEQASGKEFTAYLQESIDKPAGLLATRADNHFVIIPHRARGYIRFKESEDKLPNAIARAMKSGELYNAPLHDTSVKIPGGGLVSTAPDLVRFATAVNSGKLLRPESLKAMWEPQHTVSGKSSDYGLGWRIMEQDGEKIVGHSGGQSGVSTYFMLCPEKGTAAAVMCNLQNADLRALCLQLLEQADAKSAAKAQSGSQ
jgi:CubicO group peptidase (beta-lactamase class C family)